MCDESDIRVNAETASSICMRMVETSTEVNCPFFMVGNASSFNRTKTMSLKFIKQLPTQDPTRQEAEWHFNNAADWNCIV
jgi:hypothetical protein